MNDDMTGQHVGSALRDHVPSTPQAPFGLDDVKGRAGAIRRRRATAAVAMAAVAAALIAPTAFLATRGGDPTGEPLAPATQSPTALPGPRDDVALTADAPRGEGAEGWFNPTFRDDVLPPGAAPDPRDTVTRFGDRWLISYGGGTALRLVDPAEVGAAQDFVAASGAVVNEARDLAAFTTPDGDVQVLDTNGRTRVLATLPRPGSGGIAIHVDGEAGCVDESATDDCQVLVSFPLGSGPMLAGHGGTWDSVDDDAAFATARHGSTVALRDPALGDAEAPCSRMVDLGGAELWRSCELGVGSFSPDGRLVAVVDAYQSGWGPARIGIADAATGTVLFWITPPGENHGVSASAWEDAEHLVVSTFDFDAQEWRLFRVSTTGEVEQAADVVAGDDMAFPFIAANNP